MCIVRIYKKSHFKTIDNRFLERMDLSGKAKAVLAYLVSRPDDWSVRVDHLVNKCFKEGRQWVYSALKELEKFGYIKRSRVRGQDGKLGEMEYHVYEIPHAELIAANKVNGQCEPDAALQHQVVLSAVAPCAEKPHPVFQHRATNNITKQEEEKENKQTKQTKALSVTFFSGSKTIGDSIDESQRQRIREVLQSLPQQPSN